MAGAWGAAAAVALVLAAGGPVRAGGSLSAEALAANEAAGWTRVWDTTHEWALCAESVVLRERGVLDRLHMRALHGKKWRLEHEFAPFHIRQWSEKVRKQVAGAGLVEEAGETRGRFTLEWPRHLYNQHRMVFGCQEVCHSCSLLGVPYPHLGVQQIHVGYAESIMRHQELYEQTCPPCNLCPELPKATVKCGAATEFTVDPSAEADVQLNVPVRAVLGSKTTGGGAGVNARVAKIFYSRKSSYHFFAWAFYLGWAGAMAQSIQTLPGGGRGLDIADLACGSGWMGMLLGAAFPESRVHFADIDPGALNDVRTAVAANGMAGRATVSQGDLWRAFEGLKGEGGERKRFHHVYFYPPQTELEEGEAQGGRNSSIREVAVSAPERLFFFERCAKEWTQWLRPGGTLWLGTDHENLAEVKHLFERYAGGRQVQWRRWFLAPSMSAKKPAAVWWTASDIKESEVSQLLALTLLD